MKILKLVLLSLLMMPVSLSAAEDKNDCFILSSPPDYTLMSLYTADSVWQSISVVSGADYKYTSFGDAYKAFYGNLEKAIIQNCKKHGYHGVANLKIQHSVTEKQYNFTAVFDYWKYKK
ncbi:TPA: hypothetical protein AB5H75_004011 [Vibrio mimicus]|uniref:hypothetical protein n=1 Tax=Vibrio TaxID=662 RepID=UPI00053C0831|nr:MULTISPECIES: hypothetical protein [Vibrio]ELE7142871.1 hypothetical protein [Vibrio cholerae]ELU8126839.1 hypothetical protein [Vibrio cholerae]MCX9462223.1 hypothetical protein [Vibrio cholerae]MDP4494025.1 hypothetical protein [Vibrio sp. AH4]HDI3138767.1 hypothetical protein [Vibrio cholerae]